VFEQDLQYFVEHQEELVQKYEGRVLVIKDQRVIGAYDSALEAYLEAQKNHQVGSFLIQPCHPGADAYTVTITSHAVHV
jgi:hypothetical protein